MSGLVRFLLFFCTLFTASTFAMPTDWQQIVLAQNSSDDSANSPKRLEQLLKQPGLNTDSDTFRELAKTYLSLDNKDRQQTTFANDIFDTLISTDNQQSCQAADPVLAHNNKDIMAGLIAKGLSPTCYQYYSAQGYVLDKSLQLRKLTLLHIAAAENNAPLIHYFIRTQPDWLKAKDNNGNTPGVFAKDNAAIAAFLDAGVMPDPQLFYSQDLTTDVLQKFLQKDPSLLNATLGPERTTKLMLCANSWDNVCLRFLVANGADVKITQPDSDYSAADFAKVAGNSEGFLYLKKLGSPEAKVDPVLYAGKTVKIPQGSFTMGDNKNAETSPAHQVKVPGFHMQQHEVTWKQYMICMGAGVCSMGPYRAHVSRVGRPPQANDAVTFIKRKDIDTYIDWLAQVTAQPWRLPSEAEWEYAARAGSTTTYPWGNQFDPQQPQAKLATRSDRKTFIQALKQVDNRVMRTPPNAWGLFDMIGNARELVADCWLDNYQNAPKSEQPVGQQKGADCNTMVLRGGSKFDNYKKVTTSTRTHADFDSEYTNARFKASLFGQSSETSNHKSGPVEPFSLATLRAMSGNGFRLVHD